MKKKRKNKGTPVPPELPAKNWQESSYRFVRDFVRLFDVISLASLIIYTISIYQFLNLEMALVLGAFYMIRGVGHFWGLRQCGLKCGSIRFIPILGGYVTLRKRFRRRWEEGFSSMGASFWVLESALISFSLYLITGNFSLILFASTIFGIGLFALFPIGDLDGTKVLKAIAFSISRLVGLLFIFIQSATMLALFYWGLSKLGPVNISWLVGPLIDGVQRFVEEYRRPEFSEGKKVKFSMEPMNSRQVKWLFGLYVFTFSAFLFIPQVLSISLLTDTTRPEVEYAVIFGVVSLILMSIVESNIIFFVGLKRRLFGNI